ncbi:MAG: sigma-54-dependent Fis family transcriptional regulator [Bdellovibrionales bacterium]|nr:sigma-54-dependent Fis family transcriptional regulator [Bdellovibrionales bacterium]
MYKILIVDDDAKNLKATQAFLSAHGFDVKTTTSPDEAIDLVKVEEFALALLDYQMPQMKGDSLAARILSESPNQQIAMYSCDLSRDAVKNSMKAGAVDFIEKTLPPAELLNLVNSYCNRYELIFRTIRTSMSKSESRQLIESIGMVGQSEVLAQTAEVIRKVAPSSDTSVLIRGESGTGKELVARAIHNLSSRASSQFVAINCGAIPRELLESELFGHMKGAFTGAIADKAGKIALANRGTLFLDEIGDMPMELQVKLLRVLQEREITPVGGRIPQKINVRIVSATHRNIEDLVHKGLFREDLMYRIRVVDVEVPPLRVRPDDIEPLVAHFTERFNRKNGSKKYFQRRTLDVLKRYSWPGNVRELEGVVEKHMVVSNESMIRPDDLDLRLYEASQSGAGRSGGGGGGGGGLTFAGFRSLKRDDELSFLENAIKETGGNKAEAARRLQITANHLQHLLKQGG